MTALLGGRERLEPALVSVVIPARDEAATLAATLASVAAQRYAGPVEVIVVDNASADATASIARDAGARVVAEPRPGVCRARQTGVEAARGAIVVSTDADTVHPPDWLSRLVAGFGDLRGGSPTVAVAGPCRYLDPPWWAALFPPIGFALVRLAAAVTGRVSYLTATNAAFLASAFPGYDVALEQGGDEVDLLRRLRQAGRVRWVGGNAVLTSSRRLEEGLLHTVLVSYGYYYLGQRLWRRVRPDHRVRAAPTVRAADAVRSAGRRRRWRLVAAAALLLGAHAGLRRQRRSGAAGRGPTGER
ncbi:glycosyltransferase involved in cell wall biosynthesis [Friedmanniella endophytica]|uniref:4,4'-diaponeurosporenoate glycosyltransferase n=1 Tax=Microlunatus kandeliicorticis TaxID=1759536 RepID=A0A7W3ITM7_9ACTN|nr:glycosyltransferase family 2 protein [Microlunatus kandeliicorticis]MBA8795032.1 glycosyltransferase involved in cell wall biosynthesis [Microlunatus kandeliicorticis]